MVLECADLRSSPGGPSHEWIDIKTTATNLLRHLADIKNTLTVRLKVVPGIADANLSLLKAAALSDAEHDHLAESERTRLIGSAKTAIARCLPYMQWATDRIRADYRNAIQSIVALDSGTSSKAISMLIALAPFCEPGTLESPSKVEEKQDAADGSSEPDSETKSVLILNRLTRDPTNIHLLREFSDGVLGASASPDRDALDAAQTVLTNAIYRVDELHIPELLALLEQLDATSRFLQQTEDDSDADASKRADIGSSIDDAASRLRSLQEDIAAFLDCRGALSDGIQQISSLLDDPSATADQRNRANIVLSNYVEAEQARNALHYLSASCARLEDLKTSSWPTAHLDEAVSVLNASEQLLSSLWGLSKSATSGAVKARCEELPRLLADYRELILHAKSRDGLSAIADKANESEKLTGIVLGVPVNDSLTKLEAIVRAAEGEFLRLPSPRAQAEAQPVLQKMQASVAALRREQLNRYQHHVIAKCKEVLRRFDDQWYCTEGEAIRYFERNNLAEVDHSLLTPEVSRCFNDCIGKLFSKMKPRNLVNCEEAMGRPEGKLKLESF